MISVYAEPPQTPGRVHLRADHRPACRPTSSARSRRASSAATRTAAKCGCIASAGLDAVGRHRLPGGLRVGAIFEHSLRIGRGSRSAMRDRRTVLIYLQVRCDFPEGQPHGAIACASSPRGLVAHRPSAARPHRPDSPLQHRLRLLQRVRQGLDAGAARRHAGAHRQARRRWARSVVAFSGGEPMLHPDLDALIRAHPLARHDRRAHHQRLPAVAEADPRAQRRRARLPADQHRQRRAGRGLEEEPAAARQEAAVARRARALRRQHQLGGRRRDQESGRRAHHQPPGPRARLLDLDRHHPRRLAAC